MELKNITPLSVDEFKNLAQREYVILDTRAAREFMNGFIPGSVFIGMGGKFEEWAKTLLSIESPILLITPKGEEEDSFTKLSHAGFEKIEGFLKGGFEAWKSAGEKIDLIIDIEADELDMDIRFDQHLTVLDVRRFDEFADGHIKNAINLPLAEMADIAQIARFEENQNIYIHCASGYRSVIAASILKKHGYHNVRNVSDDWLKIKKQKNIITEKDAARLN